MKCLVCLEGSVIFWSTLFFFILDTDGHSCLFSFILQISHASTLFLTLRTCRRSRSILPWRMWMLQASRRMQHLSPLGKKDYSSLPWAVFTVFTKWLNDIDTAVTDMNKDTFFYFPHFLHNSVPSYNSYLRGMWCQSQYLFQLLLILHHRAA